MRRFTFFVLALGVTAAVRINAPAQEADKGKQAAKQAGQEILRALTQGRYTRFAELTHPQVVELAGGRDKMIALMKAVDKKMQSEGWSYGPATVSDPTQLARKGKELVAIIPTTIEYVGKGRKRKSESYLIGFSPDAGKSWTFVEGSKITKDNVKQIFPNFPDSIKLPATAKEKK